MNDSPAPIIDRLEKSKRVLVTTHVRPDGDALGTSAAVVLALRHRNIHAEVLILSKLPGKYSFIFEEGGIVHRTMEPTVDRSYVDSFDTLFIVDTGTKSQLPGLEKIVQEHPHVIVMDHHKTQESWGEARWVDSTASAAGEMAHRLVRDLGAMIDRPMALALFIALASDTGWFQFSNTTPATMRIVADLMEAGIDFDQMNQLLNQNERVERLMLQQRAMNSLVIEGNLALLSLSKRDFEETNGSVRDTENLVNLPLIARDIQISILLTEQPEGGPIRVSLRSKGQIDCAKFAEQFGGGGHARAAGLRIEGTIDESISKIKSALRVFK